MSEQCYKELFEAAQSEIKALKKREKVYRKALQDAIDLLSVAKAYKAKDFNCTREYKNLKAALDDRLSRRV